MKVNTTAYHITNATKLTPSSYIPPKISNLAEHVSTGSLLLLPSGKPGLPLYGANLAGLDRYPIKIEPVQPVAPAPATDAKPDPITFLHVAETVGAGSTLSYGIINLPSDTTHTVIVESLKNFIPHSEAQKYADSVLTVVRSNLGKVTCLFLASSTMAIGVIEAVKPGWSLQKKVAVSFTIGALATAAIALILFKTSGGTKSTDYNTPPPATSTSH